jgi:hypothetical protein
MDHSKIAFPRLVVKNKMVLNLGQFIIILTGMLVHGHGNEVFVQHSNKFWPNDSNFTIGSLLQLFQALEKEPISESRLYLNTNHKMHLFKD